MNQAAVLFTENSNKEIYSKAFPVMLSDLLDYLKDNGHEAQNEPFHQFIEGAYARELFIGKNELVVGGKHKTQHFTIISKGDISIATQDGVIRVQSPYTLISEIGTQRVLYAHEDTLLTTIHVTNETDISILERDLVEGCS